MTRLIQKEISGVKYYLTADDKWTPDKLKAKEYKGQFWIELIKILVDLIKILGLTNIKFVKK